MFFLKIPYEIQAFLKFEVSLTKRSIRQIVVEKLRGRTIIKSFSPELCKNFFKLEELYLLKRNWDNNNAKPISKKIIKKMKTLIIQLKRQPKIFPTFNDSIQIVYDGENGSYLEIQITKNKNLAYFILNKTKNEASGEIPFSADAINTLVDEFYA